MAVNSLIGCWCSVAMYSSYATTFRLFRSACQLPKSANRIPDAVFSSWDRPSPLAEATYVAQFIDAQFGVTGDPLAIFFLKNGESFFFKQRKTTRQSGLQFAGIASTRNGRQFRAGIESQWKLTLQRLLIRKKKFHAFAIIQTAKRNKTKQKKTPKKNNKKILRICNNSHINQWIWKVCTSQGLSVK